MTLSGHKRRGCGCFNPTWRVCRVVPRAREDATGFSNLRFVVRGADPPREKGSLSLCVHRPGHKATGRQLLQTNLVCAFHFWNLEQYQRRKSGDLPNLSDALSGDRNLPAPHAHCVEQNFVFLSLRFSSRSRVVPRAWTDVTDASAFGISNCYRLRIRSHVQRVEISEQPDLHISLLESRAVTTRQAFGINPP